MLRLQRRSRARTRANGPPRSNGVAALRVAKRPGTDRATVAALTEALQDEYHARATYRRVLDAFGPVRPFIIVER